MEQNRKRQGQPLQAQQDELGEHRRNQPRGPQSSPTSPQRQQQAGQQVGRNDQLEQGSGHAGGEQEQGQGQAGQQGEQRPSGSHVIQMSGRSGQGAQPAPRRRGDQEQR